MRAAGEAGIPNTWGSYSLNYSSCSAHIPEPSGSMSTIPAIQDLWNWLSEVSDPEIPALNVVEMGIVREVSIVHDRVQVIITPTYSGCPAMRAIEDDIEEVLREYGVEEFDVSTVLSPAWTTDWISEVTRVKMA